MIKSFHDFCEWVNTINQSGNKSMALGMIRNFVDNIILRQSSVAKLFSSKDLDLLCLTIGDVSKRDDNPTKHTNHIVYLVTELGESGGHTRVLYDIIKAETAANHTVIISNMHDLEISSTIKILLAELNAKVEIAPAGLLGNKLLWIQDRLRNICPQKTYMLLHQFDSVSVAAAQPELTGKLIFIHNSDSSLTLGVHIPHALHIDLHAKGYYQCQQIEHVPQNVVWPIVADDLGHRVDLPFLTRGHLTTCSSGGFEKFESPQYVEKVPYIYEYATILPQVLHASGGTHIHIGPLSQSSLTTIKNNLTELGITDNRFIHIPFVPILWQALLEKQVDVYIGSFPLGGGRATVEVMGCGLPIIVHSNYRSHFLSVEFEVHEKAMIWRTPNDLLAYIKNLNNIDYLREQAMASRTYYQTYHSPEILRRAIQLADWDGHLAIAPKPVHYGNDIQNFLDTHTEITEFFNQEYISLTKA